MFSKLGGGALGAPAGMLGAGRDPLRGGTLALLTGVTVVVTTRVPTMGWKALLFGDLQLSFWIRHPIVLKATH